MKLRGLLIAILALSAAWAKDWPAMREEADRGLPPWIQYYNRLKGEPRLGLFDQHLSEPESLNVRLVGKWGRGPAARVTGRDTLVYLALGSEVAIFNCVNAHNPRIVNEIQCRYVVDRVILKDSLLYAVLQGGVEVFNIANPSSVTRIKYLPISAVDMCINDTMAYTIDADSFKAYRIVAPDSFERLGACADSGYYIAADSGFAYLCDRWGLYVIDATDPMNPHQVSTLSSGIQIGSAWVESGFCYYTEAYPSAAFVIANVSDPYHPNETGRNTSIRVADIYKNSFYVYLASFQILDVSNPASPSIVSDLQLAGDLFGVWTRSPYSYSFVASGYEGLATVNIVDPVHPFRDTTVAAASESRDIAVDRDLAYVANLYSGMQILSVAVPANPTQRGTYDTTGLSPQARAVAARDSFAFLMASVWYLTNFRVLEVSDPARPFLAGTAGMYNAGQAIAIRDTLAYVAENYKLEIFSIANPRNPRLVGSCNLPNSSWGIRLRDSLAFVANLTSLQIVNVANPALPGVIGVLAKRALGVAVKDTTAFVGGVTQLYSVNVANPAAPFVIESLPFGLDTPVDLVLDGNLAFVGTSATPYPSRLRVIDISDPSAMYDVGYYITPEWVRRVFRKDGLIYAACNGGGVCIFETTSTSKIAEASPVAPIPQAFELMPNPASSFVDIRLEVKQNTNTRNTVRLYDAVGRVVLDIPFVPDPGKQLRPQRVDISALPDGCYFVSVEPSGQGRAQRMIKFGKRR